MKKPRPRGPGLSVCLCKPKAVRPAAKGSERADPMQHPDNPNAGIPSSIETRLVKYDAARAASAAPTAIAA